MPPPKNNGAVADLFAIGSEYVLLARRMDKYLPPPELQVCADDFTPVNRLILDAIHDIERDGNFPRLDRVTERLGATGNLEKVGGPGEITRIANLPHIPAILDDAVDRVKAASNVRPTACAWMSSNRLPSSATWGSCATSDAPQR